jgi:hypothetical protein
MKNGLLMALAASSFASGAANQYLYPGQAMPPSGTWFALLSAVLIFLWYRVDTGQRGYSRSIWLNLAVAALALAALPYYFFRSRGPRRGLIATGLFILAVIACGCLSTAGQYVIWYGVQS